MCLDNIDLVPRLKIFFNQWRYLNRLFLVSKSALKATNRDLDSFAIKTPMNWIGSTSKDLTIAGISNCVTSKLQQGTLIDMSPSFLLSQQDLGSKKWFLFG